MPHSAYRAAWVVAIALVVAYAVVLLQFAPPALQDYPNHLARALVTNDMLFHGGARFDVIFEFKFMAAPYILNDLLLAAAIEFLGVKIASSLWSLLVFMAIPGALLFYMRAMKLRREDQVLAFVLSLYLAANTFYFRGFLAFELAVAMVIFVLALVTLLRQRFSATLWVVYCAALGLGYLIHLSALVFVTVAFSASTLTLWRRTANVRTEALISLPIAALLAWHFLLRRPAGKVAASNEYFWGTLAGKLRHLDWLYIRFNARTDRWMLCASLVCMLWQVARRPRGAGTPATPHTIAMLLTTAAFVVLYVALPVNVGVVSWLDVRALPMIAIFLLLATLMPADMPESSKGMAGTVLGLLLAVSLAAVNLVYLNSHLGKLDAWLAQYRAVVAKIPSGSWLLPVYTGTHDRPVKSLLHAAAFTVIDRGAPNPYLFSLDLGEPMEYFRYRHRPYAPDETWYVESGEGVDWSAIAGSYAFLLVMKPYDPARIPLATTPVFENASAALLSLDPAQRTLRTPLITLKESKDFNPEKTAHRVLPSELNHLEGMRRLR
jgi:hypothetical protein